MTITHDTATGQPSVGHEYHSTVSGTMTLGEVAAAGGTVTRLRLLREGYRVDVSYVHATLPRRACPGHLLADGGPSPMCDLCAGQIVNVRVDFDSHLVPLRAVKGRLIEWAKDHGVYAKGLGLLDEGNWSVL